jgi:hypothetical protein
MRNADDWVCNPRRTKVVPTPRKIAELDTAGAGGPATADEVGWLACQIVDKATGKAGQHRPEAAALS